jgi:hypothetical protein
MDVSNKLPRQFRAGYRHLNQFFQFKWIYQYGNIQKPIPYSKINTSEEMILLTADYFKAIKNIPQSTFIFDYFLFEYLTHSIQYYYESNMITDEEKALIKNDLYALLDDLWEITKDGFYPETQNKVNLYISQLNISTNYSYTFTSQVKYVMFTYLINMRFIPMMLKWLQVSKRGCS